jgi:hypothetical protein
MPYTVKDEDGKKCVYKKDSKEKVGCTDGPIKDYLGALYAADRKDEALELTEVALLQIIDETVKEHLIRQRVEQAVEQWLNEQKPGRMSRRDLLRKGGIGAAGVAGLTGLVGKVRSGQQKKHMKIFKSRIDKVVGNFATRAQKQLLIPLAGLETWQTGNAYGFGKYPYPLLPPNVVNSVPAFKRAFEKQGEIALMMVFPFAWSVMYQVMVDIANNDSSNFYDALAQMSDQQKLELIKSTGKEQLALSENRCARELPRMEKQLNVAEKEQMWKQSPLTQFNFPNDYSLLSAQSEACQRFSLICGRGQRAGTLKCDANGVNVASAPFTYIPFEALKARGVSELPSNKGRPTADLNYYYLQTWMSTTGGIVPLVNKFNDGLPEGVKLQSLDDYFFLVSDMEQLKDFGEMVIKLENASGRIGS